MGFEVQAAEADQPDQRDVSDRTHESPTWSGVSCQQIERDAVDRRGSGRVATRERVGVEVDVGELRPRPVEDNLQESVQDFDAERASAEERGLVEPPPPEKVYRHREREQRQERDVSADGEDLECG